MAEIHVLPGIERPDLYSAPEASAVLQAAIEAGVNQVVLIGRDRTGELYLAASVDDAEKCVGLLMRAVSMISSAGIVNEAFDSEGTAGD